MLSKGTSINLLRTLITSLASAQNPHVLYVHSGFCALSASYSCCSRQFIEVPLSWIFRVIPMKPLYVKKPLSVKASHLYSFPVILVILLATVFSDGYAARNSREADDNTMVAEILDSLVSAAYFKDSHFKEWKGDGAYKYPPTFIPQFDDQTYSERIARLNSKTQLELIYNQHVRSFIRLYSVDKRKLTAKILGLTKVYFPLFEEKLRQYNIPLELKYLAIVESALNPTAISRANAKGLWQFIYGTGKIYGLESSAFVEDRFDPEKATIAACRHMRDLYNIYGDWFLVLAAYNSGPGNVNKAIRRSGGARDYWAIRSRLPSETRGYVPAFIAVTYVMNYYREHNIRPIEPGYLYTDIGAVRVSDAVAFDQISEVIGVPVEDLQFLNPQFKLSLVPADARNPYYLRIPKQYVEEFASKEKEIYAHKSKQKTDRLALLEKAREVGAAPVSTKKNIHVVSRGETLASIARMYRCYVSQLVQWNDLKNSRIFPGQKLKVFGAPGSSGRSGSKAPSIVYHKVRRGENLGLIAKKYGVGVSKLVSWNNLGRKRTIYPGQKLKVHGAVSSASSSGVRSHKVKKGENLGLIAKKYGVGVSKLVSWNNLGRKRTIYPGQKLKVHEAVSSASSSSVRSHKVKKGENLGLIARKYGVSVGKLVSWNNLGRKRTIYPGQRLKFSAPIRYHKVRRGENLGLIARKYGVSVGQLVSWNNLGRKRTIYPGQKLKIETN